MSVRSRLERLEQAHDTAARADYRRRVHRAMAALLADPELYMMALDLAAHVEVPGPLDAITTLPGYADFNRRLAAAMGEGTP